MSSKQHIAPFWPRLGLGEPRYAFVFLAYLLLNLLVTLHHQPWRDEAQAWLLARDNTLLGILKLERYEAIPGLWHLLLFLPTHLGMPYITLHLLHWAINGLAVYVILKWLRFDFQSTVGIVFSYLVFYEYGVIARNYVLTLLGLAILAAAWFGPWSKRKYWIYLGFFLTAGSSAFGLWLAAPIALALSCKICRELGRRKAIAPTAFFAVVGILCFLPIMPGVCANVSGQARADRHLDNLGVVETSESQLLGAPVPGSRAPPATDAPAATNVQLRSANVRPEALPPRNRVRAGSPARFLSQHALELIAMASYFAFSQGGVEECLYLANLPMLMPQWQAGLGLAFLAFAMLFLLRNPCYAALFIGMTAGVLAIIIAIPLSPTNLRHSCSIFLAFLFCWWLMKNAPESHGREFPGFWPRRLRAFLPRLRRLRNSFLEAGIGVILLLQLVSGAAAVYDDCRGSFSQAENTARYLKTQGLLPNDHYFWISCESDAASGILAYFDNLKMYSLNSEKPESHVVWNRDYFNNQHLTSEQVAARLKRIAASQPGKTVMILANHKLTFSLGRSHTLQLLKSFEPALKDNENFYIYKYR